MCKVKKICLKFVPLPILFIMDIRFIMIEYLFEKKELPLPKLGLLRLARTLPYILDNKIYPSIYKAHFNYNPNYNTIYRFSEYLSQKTSISIDKAHEIYKNYIEQVFFNTDNSYNNVELSGIGTFCKNEHNEWHFFLQLNRVLGGEPLQLKSIQYETEMKERKNFDWYKTLIIILVIAFILIAYQFFLIWDKG